MEVSIATEYLIFGTASLGFLGAFFTAFKLWIIPAIRFALRVMRAVLAIEKEIINGEDITSPDYKPLRDVTKEIKRELTDHLQWSHDQADLLRQHIEKHPTAVVINQGPQDQTKREE